MLQVYDQSLQYCNFVLEELKTHVTKTDFVVCLAVLAHLLFCLAVILCMCAAISLFFLYGPRRPATVANARPVLQALLEVVTPTQSIWPSQYASLAYRAAVFSSVTSKKTTIWIPLSTLYDDILSERLELRNPRILCPCYSITRCRSTVWIYDSMSICIGILLYGYYLWHCHP